MGNEQAFSCMTIGMRKMQKCSTVVVTTTKYADGLRKQTDDMLLVERIRVFYRAIPC